MKKIRCQVACLKWENTILSLFKDKVYSIYLTAKEEVGEARKR